MDVNSIAKHIAQDIENERVAFESSHVDVSKLNYKLTISEELLIMANISKAHMMLSLIAKQHNEHTLLISSVLAQELVDNGFQIWASIDEGWEEIEDGKGNVIDCEISCTCYPEEEGEEVPPLNDKLCKYCIEEHYWIEYNGEHFQSVFPSLEAEKSQLHTTMLDAYNYFTKECGIKEEDIKFALDLFIDQRITKEMIAKAGAILFDEDYPIKEQIERAIIEYGKGKEIDILDHVFRVQTIEQFECVFTVKDFLNHIGFEEVERDYIYSAQDLIDKLQTVKDKTKPVFAYDDGKLFNIVEIDYDISDRVDMNLKIRE